MYMFRILINHVVLTPWQCGIGMKPSQKVNVVLKNLRVVGSLVYEMLRAHDSLLLRIEDIIQIDTNLVSPKKEEIVNNSATSKQNEKSSVVHWMADLVVSISGVNNNIISQDRIDKEDTVSKDMLSDHRLPFISLHDVLSHLFTESELSVVIKSSHVWLQELGGKLDHWVTSIVSDIVSKKVKDDAERAAK